MASPVASANSAIVNKARNALSMAASVAASMVVARSFINNFIPYEVQAYVREAIGSTVWNLFFSVSPWATCSDLTLVIDQCGHGGYNNILYDATVSYLGGKTSPTTRRLRCSKQMGDRCITVAAEKDEEVTDVYGGVQFSWRLKEAAPRRERESTRRSIELTFRQVYKDMVIDEYLPHLLELWKSAADVEKPIRLHMFREDRSGWSSVPLDHPATFETVAMDPETKHSIVDDLERFVRRRDYYRKVGKAWKRGYLLYGPPGTGKSSLIAAMANYLKFDVYDLELSEVTDNSRLRSTILNTRNRSILVVEDADCSLQLRSRTKLSENENGMQDGGGGYTGNVTLSGVLNMIDGLLSSCGDERIIVLTTNHKDRLDPALLRPGRMDLHIHMSYCSPAGFRILADNYHEVKDHRLFPEIERLLQEEVNITPAEITGELMKSEHADEAFQCLVDFILQKQSDLKRRKTAAEVPDAKEVTATTAEHRKEDIKEDEATEVEETMTTSEYSGAEIITDKIRTASMSSNDSDSTKAI